ncbi:hypothetical protein [Microbacterium sp.]|nr:hypothetical protein [Microbacterium sp.]MDP3950327.1 hypothetical protein [Microbacterium sp.]
MSNRIGGGEFRMTDDELQAGRSQYLVEGNAAHRARIALVIGELRDL